MQTAVLRLQISRALLFVPVLLVIIVTANTGLLTPKTAHALDNEEALFLQTINNYRAQNGLGPLAESPALDGVAEWMANDMATKNYFSHEDSLGRDPFARMDDLGYGYNTWRGENLVAGTETSDRSFYMWQTSPPHNDNMLGSHYTVIGIARAYDPSSTFGWYWATEFGGESDVAPPPPPPPPPPPAPTPAPVYNPPPQQYVPPAPAPVQQQDSAPPPPAPTDSPTPTPVPVHEPLTPAHSGTYYEGEPFDGIEPLDYSSAKPGGSFLGALLNLAPAAERAFDRVAAVRNVR
jgi:uncharacterized protein YkwD